MSMEYQRKMDHLSALYPDKELPLRSRHAFELFEDLHNLVSVMAGRISQLEEQVMTLNRKMG